MQQELGDDDNENERDDHLDSSSSPLSSSPSRLYSSTSLKVLELACCALCNLAFNNDKNTTTMARLGAINLLVRVLKRHTAHTSVQKRACQALCVISHVNDENNLLIATLGGIDCIINVMKQHNTATATSASLFPDSVGSLVPIHNNDTASLTEQSCRALRSLATHHERNKEMIADLDGIPEIIHAMKLYPFNPSIQQHACGLLCNLAFHDNRRINLIVKYGGIDVTVQAMRRHATNPMILHNASWVLHNLTDNNDANRETVARLDEISFIISVMNKQSDSMLVEKGTCLEVNRERLNLEQTEIRAMERRYFPQTTRDEHSATIRNDTAGTNQNRGQPGTQQR